VRRVVGVGEQTWVRLCRRDLEDMRHACTNAFGCLVLVLVSSGRRSVPES
jgi:hypothetical protein